MINYKAISIRKFIDLYTLITMPNGILICYKMWTYIDRHEGKTTRSQLFTYLSSNLVPIGMIYKSERYIHLLILVFMGIV